MATSQIVFTTDAELKKETLQKLKREGTTLKSLLQYAMKAYVQWRISLGIITRDDMRTPALEKEYQEKAKDLADWKEVVERDALIKKHA